METLFNESGKIPSLGRHLHVDKSFGSYGMLESGKGFCLVPEAARWGKDRAESLQSVGRHFGPYSGFSGAPLPGQVIASSKGRGEMETQSAETR